MSLLKDENGKTSFTRLTGLIMLTLFVVIALTDTAGVTVAPQIVYTIINTTLMFCLGGTALRGSIKNQKAIS